MREKFGPAIKQKPAFHLSIKKKKFSGIALEVG